MNAIRSTLALLILSLVIAVPAMGQADYDAPAGSGAAMSVHGTIISKTSDSVTVRTDAGQEMTFNLGSGVILPSNAQVGSSVEVDYRGLAGGKYEASMVTVSSHQSSAPVDEMPAGQQSVTSPSPAAPTRSPAATSTYPSASRPAGSELPATASPLPWVGIAGALALAGWFALRRGRAAKQQ